MCCCSFGDILWWNEQLIYIINLNLFEQENKPYRQESVIISSTKTKTNPTTNTIQRVLKNSGRTTQKQQQHKSNNNTATHHNKNDIMQHNKNKNKSINFTSVAGSLRDTQSGSTYSYDHKWIFLCLPTNQSNQPISAQWLAPSGIHNVNCLNCPTLPIRMTINGSFFKY